MDRAPKIIRDSVDPRRSQAAFDIVTDMLTARDFLDAEVTVAMLTVVAHQYTKRTLSPEELSAWLVSATDFAAEYWKERQFNNRIVLEMKKANGTTK